MCYYKITTELSSIFMITKHFRDSELESKWGSQSLDALCLDVADLTRLS